MRAVTDPGSEVTADEKNKPGLTNLLRIYSALARISISDIEARYAGQGYGAVKKDLADLVAETFAPIRERTGELLADPAELDRMLAVGAAKAGKVARETMTLVRDNAGLLAASG
jgi:tryptophanyl-tRNA synthetase